MVFASGSWGNQRAPEAVYQTERNGALSYTIPGLQPGASYTVLLHFAETYFSAAEDRFFSVAINGTTANPQGQIEINYIRGSADQPKSSGVEIRGVPNSCTLLPAAAATGLIAPKQPLPASST